MFCLITLHPHKTAWVSCFEQEYLKKGSFVARRAWQKIRRGRVERVVFLWVYISRFCWNQAFTNNRQLNRNNTINLWMLMQRLVLCSALASRAPRVAQYWQGKHPLLLKWRKAVHRCKLYFCSTVLTYGSPIWSVENDAFRQIGRNMLVRIVTKGIGEQTASKEALAVFGYFEWKNQCIINVFYKYPLTNHKSYDMIEMRKADDLLILHRSHCVQQRERFTVRRLFCEG